MAFPKSHEILALTSQPQSNNRVSDNFLTRDILNEAVILVRSLSPEDVFRLAKTEASTIAFTLGERRDEYNRQYIANDIESGQPPGGIINHLDNRINVSFPGTSKKMGLRIQQFANKVVLAAGGVVGVVSTGVWAAQGSRLGSIVTRGIIPIAVLAGTAVANHAVTNKITVVNQMAAHIKNLADMFNSIHNAFIDFSSESKSKHAQFMPEPPSENGTITFENKVTDNNAVPTNYTDSIQAIVRRFITGTYQRVDIVGQSDMFIKVFFSDGELVISQCEYDFLSILKC